MNKIQRAYLDDIKDKLRQLSLEVEAIADEEQAKYDDLNEGMQAMEHFQKLQENADTLYTAQESIEEALSTLEELEE